MDPDLHRLADDGCPHHDEETAPPLSIDEADELFAVSWQELAARYL